MENKFEDFIKAGYVKCLDGSLKNTCKYVLQKKVVDELGKTKYFITVYAFDFQECNTSKDWAFQAEVHLYQKSGSLPDGVLSFQVVHVVESISAFEKLLEDAYESLDCVLDIHSN